MSECTFRPSFSTPTVRAVTPERARRLFERHLSWKQRLNDESDRRRHEKREADEREIRALRRSKSADMAMTSRGTHQHAKLPDDVDNVFKRFYERNAKWQRARDARIEQMREEEIARQLQPPPRPRSARSRSCDPGTGNSANRVGEKSQRTAVGKQEDVSAIGAGSTQQSFPNSSTEAAAQLQADQPLKNARQPVRALRQDFGINMADGESAEVMDHLQALKRCLVSSQSRNSGTWQRTIRIETARLSGAGAAPLRASRLSASALPSTSATSSPTATARARTRSPAVRDRQRLQSQASSMPVRAMRSRDPSPVVAERAHALLGPPRSPCATPRGALGAETRRRPSPSPAPPRPRLSNLGNKTSAA